MRAPTTNLSLLERIREGDPVSWQEFYQRYQHRAIDLLRKRQTGQKYFAPLEAADLPTCR